MTNMKDTNPHAEHRSRLRDTIRIKGADDLPGHTVLEFLLFHTIQRKDVNGLAHELIRQFGSFSGVLDAGYEQLVTVKGVGEQTAVFLSALPGVCRFYKKDRSGVGITFECVEEVDEYLHQQFFGYSVETLIIVCLDSSNRLRATHVVASGDVDSVPMPVRKIVSHALAVDAKRIAIGHNHPRGFLYPSDADIDGTRELQRTLAALSMELVDHIIANDEDYISLRKSGLLANRDGQQAAY